MHQIK